MKQWFIFWIQKGGWLRATCTYSQDAPYQVRLSFLSDFPEAQEIISCQLTDDAPRVGC